VGARQMRVTPSPEQCTEWRRRMVEAIISRAFDDETLAEMLMAGFDEAHTEGLLDAADICRDIAEASPPGSRVARVLENASRINRLPISSRPMLPALAWTQPCFPGIGSDRGF
jgi:hypothetical protein